MNNMNVKLNGCLLDENKDYDVTNTGIELNIKHKFTHNLILKVKAIKSDIQVTHCKFI